VWERTRSNPNKVLQASDSAEVALLKRENFCQTKTGTIGGS